MWDLIVTVPDHCLSFYFVEPSNVVDILPYNARSDYTSKSS